MKKANSAPKADEDLTPVDVSALQTRIDDLQAQHDALAEQLDGLVTETDLDDYVTASDLDG